jgi:hypothetical protein
LRHLLPANTKSYPFGRTKKNLNMRNEKLIMVERMSWERSYGKKC